MLSVFALGKYRFFPDAQTQAKNCLNKNLNAPRPSEHPPQSGGKISKRLGGIIGCKYKTSSWHLKGFPDGSNIGSTVYTAQSINYCYTLFMTVVYTVQYSSTAINYINISVFSVLLLSQLHTQS